MEVQISKGNWNKIQNYANAAYDLYRAEIGGMAVCVENKEGDWVIEQPIILKQEVSAGNCVLDKGELARYYTKIGINKKYKNANYRFLWWHSHHTMGAFWSGTDLTAIEEFSEGDFSFALVVNLKEEYKMRVSVWQPLEMHEDVELEIIGAEKSVPKKILDEVSDLCSKPETTVSYSPKTTITKYGAQKTLFTKPTDEEVKFTNQYTQVWDGLEQSLGEVISGEMDFKKFTSLIDKANNELKKANVPIHIKKPANDSACYLHDPSELIGVDKKYTELAKEIVSDLRFDHGYNSYYGGWI